MARNGYYNSVFRVWNDEDGTYIERSGSHPDAIFIEANMLPLVLEMLTRAMNDGMADMTDEDQMVHTTDDAPGRE